MEKLYARTDEAVLDFDFRRTPRKRPIFAVLRIVGLFPPRWIEDTRTRRGWHTVVKLPRRITFAEQVALQFACGSDRRREALNLMRVISIRENNPPLFWRKRWNVLFERKL